MNVIFFLLTTLFIRIMAFACEEIKEIQYPISRCDIEFEIDKILYEAENLWYRGSFDIALDRILEAEVLFSSEDDNQGVRNLRLQFDKALTVTCIEGDSEISRDLFSNFARLLESKNCMSQLIQNGQSSVPRKNWPFGGPPTMTREECLDAVDNTVQSTMLALSALPLDRAKMFLIQSTVYSMGRGAKKCCTEYGFWKTCVQPLIDAWQNMKVFGIPPDPMWD